MIDPFRVLRLLRAMPLLLLLAPAAAHGASTSPPLAGAACGSWMSLPSPSAGTPTAYLAGVGGSGPNDVWAVGHHADYSDGDWFPLFRHWNGTSWSAVASPSRRGLFYSVAASSRTNAWAVGEGPIIAHWNGITWSLVSSPRVTFDPREPASLRGVAIVSANNVWAVGLNWHYPTRQLIEHWNGRRWRVIPGVPGGPHPLLAIAALSATNIWAAGDGMEHWNGSTWTLVPAPVAASAITAVAPNDIWAVGNGDIEHWNGSTWSLVPAPNTGEQFTGLTGIAALSARNIWVVGFSGHIIPHDGYAEHPLVEHWNGSVWKIVSIPAPGVPDSQLLAATATSFHTIWAVGFAGKHRAGSNHALIERYRSC